MPETIPGDATAMTSPVYRRLAFATLVIGLLAFFYGLGDIALLSFNEARRALPAQAMFLSGDWLLPRINGELYLTKPPLLYWLQALVAVLHGAVNEWAVRLPSAIAATLTVLGTYHYTRRLYGAWPALFAAQLLIANLTFAMFARRAEIEMLLTALCIGALLCALHYVREGRGQRWILLSYGLLALAMLTKGPLVLLFVTLPLLLTALYTGDKRCWQVLRSPLGWTIFAILGLSWYALVTWRLGPDIWSAIVHRDMVEKIQGDQGKPLWSYILWMLVDFLPAGLLLLVKPADIWQRCKAHADQFALLLAVLVPLLIFSLFSNKHAKYLLPIYPLLAILLGTHLGAMFERARLGIRRLILSLGLLLPLGYLGYYAVAEARIYDYRVAAFPQFRQWSQQLATERLYVYRDVDERLLYYSARPIQVVDAQAAAKLNTDEAPRLLLADSKDLAQAQPQMACEIVRFAPYLKKDKSLVVFGNPSACEAMAGKPVIIR